MFLLLALAFVAEIGMLAGLAWGGWAWGSGTAASLAMALALPSLAAVIWGAWCAPRSRTRLPTAQRWAVKVVLFAVTFLLLLGADPQPAAALFGLGTVLLFLVSLPADRRS